MFTSQLLRNLVRSYARSEAECGPREAEVANRTPLRCVRDYKQRAGLSASYASPSLCEDVVAGVNQDENQLGLLVLVVHDHQAD